jgi:hypothetical protein
MELKKYENARKELMEVAESASSLTLIKDAGAAFEAVMVVSKLRTVLTDEVMEKVFMPLMNTTIGFLTDKPTKRNPQEKYKVSEVRDCIIDAFSFGLLPTFNQFNIIAGRMYPTKEGYTALLKKIGVKYIISCSHDMSQKPNFAEIQCKIDFEYNDERKSLTIIAVVKKDTYSSYDQLKGKAERRAKKSLYEYVTGLDLGEDDSSGTIDANHEELKTENKNPKDLFNGNNTK